MLLAEAGSGKSAELKEQARAVSAEGAYGFYTEVKAVGRGARGLGRVAGPGRADFQGPRSGARCLPRRCKRAQSLGSCLHNDAG